MSEQNSQGGGISIIGAGLVGSLLAISLAKRGFTVDVFERRPDMRKERISAGRSINLAISTRGLKALTEVGLKQDVLQFAIPMLGRMVHLPSGELSFQRYGKDDSEYINSISRADLNKLLMTKAEETGCVKIHFQQRCTGLTDNGLAAKLHNEIDGSTTETSSSLAIGTDGSASALRADMVKHFDVKCTESLLNYGYKELSIAPGPDGAFKMEKNALHIWPRGTFMLIALPNFDGSYTCTLFLPFKGDASFEHLTTSEQVEKFFQENFADAVPLLENLTETFFANPTGQMVTVKCDRWNLDGNVLLVGDASHAIVPFFGQGANAGFEDISVLNSIMDDYLNHGGALFLERRERGRGVESQRAPEGQMGWNEVLSTFSQSRQVDTNAIADMAVENFIEMRDKVADPKFLLEKSVEKILQRELPDVFRSRYQLVTFSNLPYSFAQRVGQANDRILHELCRDTNDPGKIDLEKAKQLVDTQVKPLYERESIALKL